jgi:glutamate synthase (NADPH/NADH) large chain
VLDFEGMAKLRDIERGKFKSSTIDITYPLSWGKQGVEAKLASLCATPWTRSRAVPTS